MNRNLPALVQPDQQLDTFPLAPAAANPTPNRPPTPGADS